MGLSNIIMNIKLRRLIKRGMKIGDNCKIYDTHFDYGHCFLIEIGDNVTITNSSILAHDASTKNLLGKTKVGKVEIKDNAFIGWGSIIFPNVVVGENAIVAAGSIVNKSVPPNKIVGGNPAKVIGDVDQFVEKNKKMMETSPVYSTEWSSKTSEEILKMKEELNQGIGFDE
jgi:maltose O-acetyltransferase